MKTDLFCKHLSNHLALYMTDSVGALMEKDLKCLAMNKHHEQRDGFKVTFSECVKRQVILD